MRTKDELFRAAQREVAGYRQQAVMQAETTRRAAYAAHPALAEADAAHMRAGLGLAKAAALGSSMDAARAALARADETLAAAVKEAGYDESAFKPHRIPSSTIEALEAARAKGLKIFIATGRPKAIINNLSELQDRNLIDGYITMNGAYCFVGEQVIYKSAIPQDEVKAMGDFCEKKGVPCIFVEEHNISVCQPNDMVKKIFYDFLHVNVIPTVSFEEATSKEVIQMTPFITEEEEKEIRPSIPTCEIGRWYPAFADVTAKGDTKQKGIDEIIRYFDIKLEDTMAFGDGGNDISMLRHAAIGVAMGQAKEDVKAAADYVTAPIDEDGISKAMKHFGII